MCNTQKKIIVVDRRYQSHSHRLWTVIDQGPIWNSSHGLVFPLFFPIDSYFQGLFPHLCIFRGKYEKEVPGCVQSRIRVYWCMHAFESEEEKRKYF
jgi:hypothetical protein